MTAGANSGIQGTEELTAVAARPARVKPIRPATDGTVSVTAPVPSAYPVSR